MSKKDKNDRLKRKVLLCIGLLLIIFLIIQISISYLKKKEELDYNVGVEKQEVTKEYVKDRVIPQGIYSLTSAYNGTVSRDDLYLKLNEFVNYFPDLYNDVININEQDYDKYYLNNSNNIKRYLGIISKEEFSTFIKYLKNMEFIDGEFEFTKIDKNSYKNSSNSLAFNLEFKYSNNENICFEIELANSVNSEILIKFGVPIDNY